MFSPRITKKSPGRIISAPVTLTIVPEGDSLHRAAKKLQVLTGQRVEVETPHPRAAAKGIVERLDGRLLESVEAVGKNLLLRFEGGLVLRSHLRMTGRRRVEPRGSTRVGRPWLVLRGAGHEAVLELGREAAVTRRLGPDILAEPPDFEAMVERFRAQPQERAVGDALLDQRLVAGIGNLWKAEALWAAEVSPWRVVGDVSDDELLRVLDEAHGKMKGRLDGVPGRSRVYRRAGRPCPRCGTPVRSWPQGDGARMAYWCATCQR